MRAKLVKFIERHRQLLLDQCDDAFLRNKTTREAMERYSIDDRYEWMNEFFDSLLSLLKDRHDLVMVDWHQGTLERELLSGFSLMDAGACLLVFRNQIKRLLWDTLTEPDQRGDLLSMIRTVDRHFDYQLLKKSQIYLNAIEAELAESARTLEFERNKLNALLQSIGDGVIVVDRDMNIIFDNEISRKYYGSTVGRKCYEIFAEGNTVCEDCTLEKTMEDGRVRTVIRDRSREGKRVYLEVTSAAVRDESGDIRWGIETFRDITRRREAELKIEKLNRQLKRKQDRIDRDLELAAVVQKSMLPNPVNNERVEIHSAYIPVAGIGGDYASVQFQSTDVVYVTMCDVSGHGIASALLSTRVDSQVRTLVGMGQPPAEILRNLHQYIFRNFPQAGLFFTFFCIRIDLAGRTLTWSGGGHPSAVMLRTDGSTRRLQSQNAVLGIFDEPMRDTPETTIEVMPGDTVAIFTDGLVETLVSHGATVQEEVVEKLLGSLQP
ncbi:MAG: SpoIIE family protein phosphatase, partial [Planctomycetota bacterium]